MGHSRLLRLDPVGVGTGQCEALTSYAARLAAAHSATVTDLSFTGWSRAFRHGYMRRPGT